MRKENQAEVQRRTKHTYQRQKRSRGAFIAALMLAAALLTACSSDLAEESVTTESETGTEAELTEETSAQPVEEATEEAGEMEAESAEEAVNDKYPGIDMKSELPGLEWMDTFDGIITEPKMVIFNDATNKKVIVENGEKAEIAATDTMATYIPADKESYAKYMDPIDFKKKEYAGRYTVETELQHDKVGSSFQYANLIIYGGEEYLLKASLKIVDSEVGEGTAQESGQAEQKVLWEMEESGIRNHELGIMIRRENGVLEDFSLNQTVMLNDEKEGRVPDQDFSCSYYDGGLENYIAENDGFQKGSLGKCEYAYKDYGNSIEVVFTDNGVALTTYIGFYTGEEPEGDISINEYLSEVNLQECDEFSQDTLIYLTEDGFYSPALGISVVEAEGISEITRQYLRISHEEEYLLIDHWNRYGSPAQQTLELYVESELDRNEDNAEIEGTVETTIAGYPYFGRGIIKKIPGLLEGDLQKWFFGSDETDCTIELCCWAKEEYETYLSLLETE